MRLLVRLLVCMALGLVVTIVVTLLCLSQAPSPQYPAIIPLVGPEFEGLSAEMDERDHRFLERNGINPEQVLSRCRWVGFGAELRAYDGASMEDRRAMERLQREFGGGRHAFDPTFAYTVSAGWPLFTVEGDYSFASWESPPPRRPTALRSSWCGMSLPRSPLFRGLLADTAVFGGAIALLSLVPRAIRRCFRHLDRRCVACGYLLQLPGGCPECGHLRQRSPPNERCS